MPSSAIDPPGDPRRAQAAHQLSRRRRRETAAHDLAVRARLLRPRPRGRRPGASCARAFRHFRTDRIAALTPTETRYPRRRQALLEGMARDRGHSAAIAACSLLPKSDSTDALWRLGLNHTESRHERSQFRPALCRQPAASAAFYADLLGRPPVESSPTFAMFAAALGREARPVVAPHCRARGERRRAAAASSPSPSPTARAVDATHADWRGRGLPIVQPPTRSGFRPHLRRTRSRRASPARLRAGGAMSRNWIARRLGRACPARPQRGLHAVLPRQTRAAPPDPARRPRRLLLADAGLPRQGKCEAFTAIGVVSEGEPY